MAADTKDKLLCAAERLFALEGIGAVSTRRISKEAGQRNNSALHYHFGDKETLIEAIVALRMSAVNARREQLLKALEQEKATHDVHAVMRALVLPLAEQIGQDNYYVPFLNQYYNYTRIDALLESSAPYASGMQRAAKYLKPHIKGLPKAIITARVGLLSGQIVRHIADWDLQGRRGEKLLPLALLVENLVDVLVAGLLAPVSEATAALLRRK